MADRDCSVAPQQLVAGGKLELLQEMYREWPFFQVTLDMVEMVFAKADPRVSLLYEEHLVSKELVPFGDNLRRCENRSSYSGSCNAHHV